MEGLALTAEHAVRGKLAAVTAGYWIDSYARCVAGSSAFDGSPGPLINRGQYARVAAIGSIVEQFLAATAGSPSQIVSLGAGYDTMYWQLHAANAAPRLYVELDQDEVVQRKCAMISTKPALKRALEPGADARVTPSGVTGGPDAEAGGYRLLSCNLNSVEQLEKALASAGWSASEPTLVIAECVLVYLVPDASKAILDFFGRQCSGGCVFVGYEMIGPDDPFGRTMLDNLRRRGCPLLGLPAVPDCKAQESRSLSCGFTRAEAMDVLAYYEKVVGPKERQRVNKIEMLDELEEWRMLLTHYCVSLAIKDAADGGGGGAAAALLSEVRLGKEVVAQPLVGLVTSSSSSSAAAAAADVSDPIVGGGEPNIASGAAAVVQPPQPRAPPLGNSFPEDEEDAVWSDEEEEQQQEPPQPGGGAPAGA